jgi:hypothetical protein
MQIGSKIRARIGKSFTLVLLVLFLGYYGGITLFPHSHIVNGITIVHSHPYKQGKGSNSSNLPHTGKEFQIIQVLSEFISTAVVLSVTALLLRSLVRDLSVRFTCAGYAEPGGNGNNLLRAPPLEKPILGF